MKNAPGKRPQTDTKSPTIPAAPAIDRSPAAKVQALRNDAAGMPGFEMAGRGWVDATRFRLILE